MPFRVARDRGGIACLAVGDIRKAVTFYESELGFRTEALLGEPPGAALVRRYRCRLLLQQAATRERHSLRLVAPESCDAVVFVPDVDAVFGELHASGVRVITGVRASGVSPRAFEVMDHCGNVLCIAQAALSPPRRVVAGLARTEPVVRARAGWNTWRTSAAERPYLAEFRRFVDRLPEQRDLYWMFFSGGLLHWMAKAASYVPADVNLALLGSALSPQEEEWVRGTLGRPFHHIRLPVDDKTAWEFLFEASRHSFGWLDIGCFVLNGRLFAEMANIAADTAINTAWSYDSGFGFRLANTQFLFLNAQVIRAVRARGARVGPGTYDWRGENRAVAGRRHCHSRIPSRRLRKALLQMVPPDERGRPRYPGAYTYFDSLVAYQLAALGAGYRMHQVRPLDTPILGAGADAEPRHQDASDELVHVGDVANFHRHYQDPVIRVRYLGAELVMLSELAGKLPDAYAAELREVEEDLRSLGMEPAAVPALVRDVVRSHWGLSPAGVDLLLGATP